MSSLSEILSKSSGCTFSLVESIPKIFSIDFWKDSNSEVISGLFNSSSCCFALLLACVKQGGSCSSSRSIVWNSSMVSWLEGVSRKSPNLFLIVVSLIRTVLTTSRTVRLKPCNLAATKRAVEMRGKSCSKHFPVYEIVHKSKLIPEPTKRLFTNK